MKKNATRRTMTAAIVALSGHICAVSPVHAGSVPTWDKTVEGSGRFKVLATFDGDAVLDKETGLVWEKRLSAAAQPFSGALLGCATSFTGNRRGWRLATVEELASVMDPSQANPPLAAGNPFENLVADLDVLYWTATPNPIVAGAKIAWSFANVGFVADVLLTNAVRRWCVRGGQNTVE